MIQALQRKAISVNTSGDNELVAAVTGKSIIVVGAFLMSDGDVRATFQSDAGAGAVALTGALAIAQNGGFVLPPAECGWMETAAGKKLNLSLNGAITITGVILYLLK